MNQANAQTKSAPRPSGRQKASPGSGGPFPVDPGSVSPRSHTAADWTGGAAKPKSERAAKKRGWPIMEVVMLLLLVKIALGGWYIIFGSGGSGGLSLGRQLALGALQAPGGAPASQEPPQAAAPKETSMVDGYLAAAAGAVAPAVAQAAAAPAVSSVSPISAGAFMVVGSQASGPSMAQGGGPDSIPLPPDAGLLTPAAQLPPPALPSLGGARGSAPLPPNVAAPNTAALEAIRNREQTLARQEAELATREEALTALEGELRRRLEAGETFRNENEALLQRNEAVLGELKALREEQQKEDAAQKDARIQHLVTAYGGMKPEQAGTLVNSLDDAVAVSILAAMPGRKAGLILAFVDPEKAARLTKAISDMKLDPNMLLNDNANPLAGQPAAPAGQ